jgi:Mrp family chromosome partitioning ATPase
MDVLRLAGAPGAGKSAVGWAVAERLAAQGEPIAFVDIDQLGICYPAPEGDPHRWQLKQRALGRLVDRYREAGVDRLIVSGVAHPDLPPMEHDGAGVRSLWLDAAAEVRRARLRPRGWESARTAEVVRIGTEEAARLESSWERLSTDELTLGQTVDAVLACWTLETVTGTDPPRRPAADPCAPTFSAGELGRRRVLWITGPRCVGASTVGWRIAADAWREGRRTGFIDVAQLSFTWNLAAPVGLLNGVALQETFAAAGTERFVVVAPLDIEPVSARTAFGDAEFAAVRLDATDADLRDRALARTRGEGPFVSGDDLLGAPTTDAEALIATAVARQRIAVRPGETLVDTSGEDAAVSTKRVTAAARWLHLT